MNKIKKFAQNFWNDESGVTAVEYALIVALITTAIIAAWGLLSNGIQNAFVTISTLLGS